MSDDWENPVAPGFAVALEEGVLRRHVSAEWEARTRFGQAKLVIFLCLVSPIVALGWLVRVLDQHWPATYADGDSE